MPLFKLSTVLPCTLCGQAKNTNHHACTACWQTLPWKKSFIQRNELDCFVSCHYDFPIKQSLHQFKDHAQMEYAALLTACLQSMPKPKIQAIVPMPISTEKLLLRGFDQIYTLAKGLSQAWQIPIWQPISRHDGHSQRGLSRDERLNNLNALLYLNTSICKYKHVLMLDDVITTGASLAALKVQLQQLGCTHIQALCLCDAAH